MLRTDPHRNSRPLFAIPNRKKDCLSRESRLKSDVTPRLLNRRYLSVNEAPHRLRNSVAPSRTRGVRVRRLSNRHG